MNIKRMYTYTYITESLWCTVEINTTLQINHTLIFFIFKTTCLLHQNYSSPFSNVWFKDEYILLLLYSKMFPF